MRVIDTNILVYHLTGASGELSQRSTTLMHRLRTGEEQGFLPATAVFECIYACQLQYHIPNEALAALLLEMIASRGIVQDHPEAMEDALAFWGNQEPLSFADCYHLALTKSLGLDAIYTFDRRMDRYPGVERVEP